MGEEGRQDAGREPPVPRGGPPSTDSLDYDGWFETRWGRYASCVERKALERALGPLTGLNLLDVGCGTGRFTAGFELSGASVVGVDTDRDRLAIAARRIRGQVLAADAQHLPFEDATFDVSTAITVLEFAPNPARILAEMARVTRPGGRILVAALNRGSLWGRTHRRSLQGPPWHGAVFISPPELLRLAAPFGTPSLSGALFAGGWFPGVEQIGSALESAGRRFLPRLGAFQILTLDHRAPQPPHTRRTPR